MQPIDTQKDLLKHLRESNKDRRIRQSFGRHHQRIEAEASGTPIGIRRYSHDLWEIYYERSDRYKTYASLKSMLKNSIVGKALQAGTLFFLRTGH